MLELVGVQVAVGVEVEEAARVALDGRRPAARAIRSGGPRKKGTGLATTDQLPTAYDLA